MTETKICGLSTAEGVEAALAAGAAYLGFMLVDKSPRRVSIEAARPLVEQARGRAMTVAVMVDPSEAAIAEVAATLKPDLFQLHGKETPEQVRSLRAVAGGAGMVKALPISSAQDLHAAADYDGVVDALLFDAKPPAGADRAGGHGLSFDWSLLKGRKFAKPWFLAGGLDPGNVAEAVRQSGAERVDVSSGVERELGCKDAALISAFLDAVRRA